MKNTNTNSIEAQATAIVRDNIKYSVLVVSVLTNLAVFITWLTVSVA